MMSAYQFKSFGGRHDATSSCPQKGPRSRVKFPKMECLEAKMPPSSKKNAKAGATSHACALF